MSKEIDETMKANPSFTYGMSAGLLIGMAAKAMGDKYAGLSEKEWNQATDDYSHGYRSAFKKVKNENSTQ